MNPAQTAARLLGAIEQFAEQELLALRAGDSRRARSIQGRAAPLVEHLCRLAAGRPPWWSALLSRKVEAILTRRRESRAVLARQREALLAERERLAGVRGRLRAVAPAYAGAVGFRRPLPQLNAAV
jgi:hypothetical protein